MIDITYYDKSTGVFGESWFYQTQETKNLNVQGRDYVIGKWDTRTYYMLNAQPTERPIFTPTISPGSIPADGVSTVTISGFPADSSLKISGPIEDTWDETGTTSSITVNLPGTYRVVIQKWPYQYAEVTFNAT